MPVLTVLMPVFNERATIERAIAATLAAGLPDFELLVVDDGSRRRAGASARSWTPT